LKRLKETMSNYRWPLEKRLNNSKLEKIHLASVEILESIGVRLFHQEAIDLLKNSGAKVTDGNLVKISGKMVEKAFETVPSTIKIYNREGTEKMHLGNGVTYFSTGSDCLNVLDHRDGLRRKAKLSDVRDAVRLMEALPNIDYVMSMFLPWDVPSSLLSLYQMETMLIYSKKPIMVVTPEFEDCVDCMRMAESVAGGTEQLRQKPFVMLYINLASDLKHNKESLQKLLFMAEKGLPTTYTPTGNLGALAPVTRAGAQAHINAGNLTGLVLSQLKREGTPFIFGGWGLAMDMKTSIFAYSSPDMQGIGAAQSHYYNLPFFGLSGCSDAKILDGQATAEAALTMMADVTSGAELVHDLGYMESGLMGSLQQLVICDDMIGWIRRFIQPVSVEQEELCLDVIGEVGPDGNFISTSHTVRHCRELYQPAIFDRKNYHNWEKIGKPTINDVSREKVDTILKRENGKLLSDELVKVIKGIRDLAGERHGLKL